MSTFTQKVALGFRRVLGITERRTAAPEPPIIAVKPPEVKPEVRPDASKALQRELQRVRQEREQAEQAAAEELQRTDQTHKQELKDRIGKSEAALFRLVQACRASEADFDNHLQAFDGRIRTLESTLSALSEDTPELRRKTVSHKPATDGSDGLPRRINGRTI